MSIQIGTHCSEVMREIHLHTVVDKEGSSSVVDNQMQTSHK